MDWYVMRHPPTDSVAVVPESALDLNRAREWIRVSGAFAEGEKDQLRLADFPRVDLDAEPEPTPEPAAADAVDTEEEQQ